MIKINEMKPDNTYEFTAIVAQASIGKTNGKNRRSYLNLILEDQSGQLDAKFWSPNEEQLKTCTQGQVVHVSGDVIRYNGALQMKVSGLKVLEVTEEERMQYVPHAPADTETMMKEIDDTISAIKDKEYRDITRLIIHDHRHEFMTYPAATRNHHEYVSGLLYHTYCMLKVAKGIAAVYDDLNTDLLYAGVILHDIGKVREFSGAITPTYTSEGNLLGHISIGANMVKEKATELGYDDERVTLLEHMILSHHGKNEYGSPILPQIREAEILYLVDNIDARMAMFDKALAQVEPGESTKRIFALENRSLYKPHGDQ